MADHLVFIGTLNRGVPAAARGPGLAVFAFDDRTLTTEKLAHAGDIDNPSFLSVTADGTRLYANSERPDGTVSAYGFDRAANRLTRINGQSTLGKHPVHNTITRDGSRLLVVNYGEGAGGPDKAVAVFGIDSDGALTAALGSAAQSGSGPDPSRQDRSHPHSVTETVAGNAAIVADLGTDRLVSYRIAEDGRPIPWAESALPPGAGPRHLALHASGRFAFLANELNSTVVSLSLDNDTGRLAVIDSRNAAPSGTHPRNFPGDVLIAPDGRFVYVSNRGHNTIVVFALDQDSGRLTPVEHAPCGGKFPRQFALTPSGKHLFAANQKSNRVSILERDAQSGRLADTGKSIEIGTPMCVKITA